VQLRGGIAVDLTGQLMTVDGTVVDQLSSAEQAELRQCEQDIDTGLLPHPGQCRKLAWIGHQLAVHNALAVAEIPADIGSLGSIGILVPAQAVGDQRPLVISDRAQDLTYELAVRVARIVGQVIGLCRAGDEGLPAQPADLG
jgi:hypothetical protein